MSPTVLWPPRRAPMAKEQYVIRSIMRCKYGRLPELKWLSIEPLRHEACSPPPPQARIRLWNTGRHGDIVSSIRCTRPRRAVLPMRRAPGRLGLGGRLAAVDL